MSSVRITKPPTTITYIPAIRKPKFAKMRRHSLSQNWKMRMSLLFCCTKIKKEKKNLCSIDGFGSRRRDISERRRCHRREAACRHRPVARPKRPAARLFERECRREWRRFVKESRERPSIGRIAASVLLDCNPFFKIIFPLSVPISKIINFKDN